ncbi:MAG: antibiotic biosynthesis monooxygenase [Cyclobacteriaceae bacterium]|nr:antibiotic biosynthesis monooxygenase [Cyclobacteriaceae bacterium]MCK5281295.1 antibiotic biosynthesis monooxygenase [Cyclobacteriaceae bacterium]MCK5371696.1 antibiotic biosynthesis monooxygenase [Cyclobacteriaceae bacterium]MCK5467763.1 antibiotic biosynthesis monooxygenase [Cyclobacteriaceae bacterium]MCK5700999.1 antibiotic biosynthesis monooxygenase [Cyclobacteriaceae bacterium]
MIVTFVHVWVKPEYIDVFIKASTENHQNSIKEPGNLRFDLVQDANDPSKFVIYEAYESDDAAMAHKETGHYKKWKETVAGWMAQPRLGEKYNILAPTDKSLW